MKRDQTLAWIAFAVVCIVWGTTYLGIRVAIETLPTLLLTGARFTLAGTVLLIASMLAGKKLPRRGKDWANLTLIGLLLVGVGNVAVVWAEHYITSGMAALLVALAPFWMALIERFRKGGERITRRAAAGMAVGFGGVLLLVGPDVDFNSFQPGFLGGVIAIQVGSFCWNLGSVHSKYHPVEASPLVAAAIQMITGGVIVGSLGLAAGELPSFHFNTRTLLAFSYLVVFGSILAYGAYVYALTKLKTTQVSLYAYINPVVAVFLGWLILDEELGWRAIISMVIILGGVAMVQTGRATAAGRTTAATAPPHENTPLMARAPR